MPARRPQEPPAEDRLLFINSRWRSRPIQTVLHRDVVQTWQGMLACGPLGCTGTIYPLAIHYIQRPVDYDLYLSVRASHIISPVAVADLPFADRSRPCAP